VKLNKEAHTWSLYSTIRMRIRTRFGCGGRRCRYL